MSILAEQQQNCHKRVGFSMIPLEDLEWAIQQKPAAMQLFLECWRSEPYGSRWMQLSTKLKKTAFTEAKRKLSDCGLFVFKPESSIQDGRSTVCWMVKNLHGSRVKEFWKDVADTNPNSSSTEFKPTNTNLEFADTNHNSTNTNLEFADTNSILPQTQSQQESHNASTSFQDLSSTSSSISAELESREEELELEKEEVKVSNGGELIKWVVESKIPALNLKDPPRNSEAYAKAMITRDGDALRKEFAEVMAERDFYTRADELTTQVKLRASEWEALGLKVVVYHDLSRMPAVMLEGSAITAVDFLAKPIEQATVEPVTALVNLNNTQHRKLRKSRLDSADQVAECPGVEFLAECWGDVLLRSRVKALIAKYPQWGISLELLKARSNTH